MGQGSPGSAQRVFEAVTGRFAVHAARTPDRVAVECGDERRTYAELAARVNTFAADLAGRLHGQTSALIGVCLDRDVDLPAWLLAVFRVGGAYLPLDPSSPPARLAQMLDDARPALIVASVGLMAALPPTSIPILIADRTLAGETVPPPTVGVAIRSDMLAYLIYTSGSTGRPKGVEIEHGSLAALLATMAERPGLAAGGKMLGLTRISFDLSVPDMFLPFAVGGTLALVGLDIAADPARLAEAIDRHRPDLIQATPSTWRALIEAGWTGDPRLTILAGGEAVTRDLADRLLPRCGALWNIYGPTEATVWATTGRVDPGSGPVSIGWPLGGVEIEVIDDALRPVPRGLVGEIAIGGSGVARGYRGRPELTADRFVRLPGGRRFYRTGDLGRVDPDGALFCLGRSDDQVKLRGFRIELGEVEAALAAQPEFAWCAVRVCADPSGEARLVGYVVPRQKPAPNAGAIRAALSRLLPAYMIPDRFVTLATMPLTPNGKVDRAALPSPFTTEVAPPAAGVCVLEQLAAIWCELLGVARVEPEDDFFDLGGYSLMTVRLTRRIEDVFGARLGLTELMRWSTLSAMAERIVAGGDGGGDGGVVLMNGGGSRPPLYWLDVGPLIRTVLRELPADQPALALNLTMADEATFGTGEVEIEAVARALRDRLVATPPAGAFVLGGWCRWGIVAFELARQLRRAGHGPDMLVMLDADHPGDRMAAGVRGRIAALIGRAAAAAEPFSFSQRVERATLHYRPSEYEGDVLLVRPSTNPGAGGWRSLLGERLTIARTTGDHESMVRLPHAVAVAHAIDAHLPLAIDRLHLGVRPAPMSAPGRP